MAASASDRIETLQDRISYHKRAGEFLEDEQLIADAETLLTFSDELALLRSQYSDHRHEKLLRHCTIMAENVGGLADALEDREAAEEIVRWIHAEYDAEETNRDYRNALRALGKHVVDGEVETDDRGVPVSLAWIPSSTSSSYDPAPDPGKMLRWNEEIQELLDAALNSRDKAAIALAFDAGPRGGEFEDMTVGDVSDHQHGLQVTVRGKQGQRSITLIPSVPYVRRWLDDHPAGDDPDAPLWSKLETPESLSYQMLLKMFRDPGKRAGIEKPLTPTNFRKSSAAHLASKGMNQAHIEDHHGWVRGSKVAARYVSVFSEDADRELARVYGKEVPEDDSEQVAPLDCPRCGKETPREKDLCVWCGQALEPGAAERAARVDEALVEAIAQASGEEAEELVDIRRQVTNDTELLADVVDRLGPLINED